MTRVLVVAGVVYGTVALTIGALQAVNYRRSGGNWQGTLAFGALAAAGWPLLLGPAVRDWYR